MTDSYHSDFSRVSKSMLSVFVDSPHEYYCRFVEQSLDPAEPTQAMQLGTILHAVLLETTPLDDLVVCYPEECVTASGSLNGRRAAEFRATVDPRVAMKPDALAGLRDMLNAIRCGPGSAALMSAIAQAKHREQALYAVLDGVPCKCKPDYFALVDDCVVVGDLKFMRQVDPVSFQRSSRRFRYWLQDAHYSAILGKLCGVDSVSFRFWCIETQFPFRVQPYWYDDRSRELAAHEHRRQLNMLRDRMERNYWRDDWEGQLTLNMWDLGEPSIADQLEGFGDEE